MRAGFSPKLDIAQAVAVCLQLPRQWSICTINGQFVQYCCTLHSINKDGLGGVTVGINLSLTSGLEGSGALSCPTRELFV